MTEPGTADVQNLYARLGSGSPHLCFAGHTDVVPAGDEKAWTRPPFGGVIDGGVLYGRGAADMKGGIACFVAAALDYLKASGGLKRGSLSFLITGDEEAVAINGTPKLLAWLKARGETIDGCVVGEPASLKAVGDEIKIGRRGYVNAEIVVHGKQAHAAYPQNGENPVPKLARMIDRICAKPLDAGTEHFEPSSVQPTIISVPNTATNIIPAFARVNFNIRYNNLHTPADDRGVDPRPLRDGGEGAGCPVHDHPVGHGRCVPHQARSAGEHDGAGRADGYGGAALVHDHRRHVGRALHQGCLPRGGDRLAECHGAPGGRARARRRPADADPHLPPLHRRLFSCVS